MRGKAEANPEIPRFARNRLRNPPKDEIAVPFGLAMIVTKIISFVLNSNVQNLFLAVSHSVLDSYILKSENLSLTLSKES